jgi:hypothetical protein
MTLALALLGGTGLALAAGDKAPGSASGTNMQSGTTGQSGSSMSQSGAKQDQLNLTSSQQQTISKELAREQTAADTSFQASVGAKVPSSIALKPVPMTVANDIPSVKMFSYAKLANHKIVLVDPKSRTVAAVIEGGASTTGSSPSSSSGMSGSTQNNNKK